MFFYANYSTKQSFVELKYTKQRYDEYIFTQKYANFAFLLGRLLGGSCLCFSYFRKHTKSLSKLVRAQCGLM